MIAQVNGTIVERSSEWVVVLLDAGVGLKVYVPPTLLSELGEIGERVSLRTYLDVRDDGFFLYGFPGRAHLELFELLISVSKIGPKTALGILSAMHPDEVAFALASGDEAALSRVPGVGKKSAARLVLELSERISKTWSGCLRPGHGGDVVSSGAGAGGSARADSLRDAAEALAALGFSSREIEEALSAVRTAGDGPDGVEGLVEAALRYLAGGGRGV